jgi:hypothetical protein
MTKYEIHASIAQNVVSASEAEEDLLLFMVLLHTHDIRLNADVVLDDVIRADMNEPILLPAITHRHASAVIASLWPAGDKKGKYEYWYALFSQLTPYEVTGDIPSHQLVRFVMLKQRLCREPRVQSVIEVCD